MSPLAVVSRMTNRERWVVRSSSSMRNPPFILAIALVIAACSAESAPDNAAGSVKQAPIDKSPSLKAESIDMPAAADYVEAKKVPNSNGPKCSEVTEQVCANASNQKFCSCNGPMNQASTYKCGCNSGSASRHKSTNFR